MRTCAIVNPAAGRGRVRRVWPQLLSHLLSAAPSLSVRWTTAPAHATALTRQALLDGYERIVAVGGDGTLHEVVNGFFDGSSLVSPEAVLAFVPCGSGSDFRHALGLPSALPSADRLHAPRVRSLDVLRVRDTSCPPPEGPRTVRHALNIVSAGLSGAVVRRMSQSSGRLPPRLRYLTAILQALATTRPTSVRLVLDGTPQPTMRIRLVALANGPSFAAGLPIAPMATPHDGRLHITVVRAIPAASLLRHAHRFYRGTHLALAGVDSYRARHVALLPQSPQRTWAEADGERLGRLPLSVSLLPNALRVHC
jgi:YegS/Rv2252/BmrU family lipid kinase